MIYAVEAKLVDEHAGDLHRKLTDGTIARQKPDGQEIVASMQRARVGEDGIVRWTQTCFCPTPLYHERKTVYDVHFTDMRTRLVDDQATFDGRPLMDVLEELKV